MPLADKYRPPLSLPAWERGRPEARDAADFFGGEFRLLCHTFREAMDPFEWRS